MDSDKWDQRYLSLAKFVSAWSKDPSTKVGAVVVDPRNQIVSLGYNGLPRNVLDSAYRLENREVKYKMIVHAEVNAMVFAQRDLEGCTLYTYPFMPCARCAGLVIQHGIKRVVSIENKSSRWLEDFLLSSKMFDEAGIALQLYPGVQDV